MYHSIKKHSLSFVSNNNSGKTSSSRIIRCYSILRHDRITGYNNNKAVDERGILKTCKYSNVWNQMQFQALTTNDTDRGILSCANESDTIDDDCPHKACTLDGGSQVQIQFSSDDGVNKATTSGMITTVFDALWLWRNSPDQIMPSSGQRIHSPSSGIHYDRTIVSVVVVSSEKIMSHSTNGNVPLHLPPPIGSAHPIGGVYDDPTPKTDVNHDDDSQNNDYQTKKCRWLLKLTWDKCQDDDDDNYSPCAINLNSRNATKESTTIITLYDLEWLMQWRYDDEALSLRRQRTEVTPLDTFLFQPTLSNTSSIQQPQSFLGYHVTPPQDHNSSTHDNRKCIYKGLKDIDFQKMVQGTSNDNDPPLNKSPSLSSSIHNENNNEVFSLLQALFSDGAVIVRNIPQSYSNYNENGGNKDSFNAVSTIAHKISGSLSHGTLYGDIFHVKSAEYSTQHQNNKQKNTAINIAYTSKSLPPHQDLAYYESPPGIQLLHCIANDEETVKGGESTLIDGMAAAYYFRTAAPLHFQTLANSPATFVKQRNGVCMTYLRPHIVLKEDYHNDHGNKYNNSDIHREIVAVNWAPPFEGPLCLRSNQIRPYYEAYTLFERMLDNTLPVVSSSSSSSSRKDYEKLMDICNTYANTYTWEYRLKPGEMLVFNNRRMLHGRRGFVQTTVHPSLSSKMNYDKTSKNGNLFGRHLVGGYSNIDDTLNTYRVMLRDRSLASLRIPNIGNGTSSAVP